MNKLKEVKGITLIALVITIIVLLILAGVSIATLTGQNGILTKAQNAAGETQKNAAKEELQLELARYPIEKYQNGITPEQFMDELLKEKKIEKLDKAGQNYKVTIKGHIFEVDKETLEIITDGIDSDIPKTSDATPGELSGTGTETDPYLVESIEDLVYLSNSTNTGTTYADQFIKLTLSIDFESDKSYVNSGTTVYGDINKDGNIEGLKTELTKRTGRTTPHQEGFIAIGNSVENQFQGSFNGNNKWIKNIYQEMYSNTSGVNYEREVQGLFGIASEMKNQIIENISISGNNYINNTAEKPKYIYQGSIIGLIHYGTIKNCHNSTNVKLDIEKENSENVGGISGSIYEGKVENCTNSGNIESTYGDAGGISGYAGENKIRECTNYGTIKSENCVGGIAGDSFAGDFNNCLNYGNIEGKNNVGGIAGMTGGAAITCQGRIINYGKIVGKNLVGGIIGECCNIEMSKDNTEYYYLENNGEIIGEDKVGGILGETLFITYDDNEILTNIFNKGNVTGKTRVGGIIGYIASNQLKIKNAINTGIIQGENNIGGILGTLNDDQMKSSDNVYNLGNVSGEDSVGGIKGTTFYSLDYCKNIYNLGKITAKTNTGAIMGAVLGVTKGEFESNVKEISNICYLKGTASQSTGLGEINGIEAKDTINKDEMLKNFNENVKSINDKNINNNKLLEWEIDATKNNGYPILKMP